MGHPKPGTLRWAGLLIPAVYYSLGGYGYPVIVSLLILSILLLAPAVIFRSRAGPGIGAGGAGPETVSLLLLLFSGLLVILLFHRSLAIAALVFQAAGESAAGAAEARSRRIRLPGRSLARPVAGLTASGISGALLMVLPGLGLSWTTVLAGVIAATLMGSLPIPVEAGFRVPLFSASMMHLVRLLHRGSSV